jgi:hypothetical protein
MKETISVTKKIKELMLEFDQAESNSEKRQLYKKIGELQQLKLF